MPVQPILNEGAFDSSIRTLINSNFQQVAGLTTGNTFYLDPANGADSNNGQTPTSAFKSLAAGYAALRSGYNDVLVLMGNGASSGSARLSATFTWAKNAAHLVGVCSGSRFSQRARIAPTAGIVGFANFFVVSGNGCLFQNVEWFQGFTAGVVNSICVKVSGVQNVFINCHIAGMGSTDAADAQDTGSRSLVIANDENYFKHCVIGLDTIVRTVLNGSLELAKNANGVGISRNSFEDCIFPALASTAASSLAVLVAAAGALDRMTIFTRCLFYNAAAFSGGAAGTGVMKLLAAAGGAILLQDCTEYGYTDWGYDAASKAEILVSGAVPTGNSSGIAVVNT